jgi:succinate-semialdehyde dehydrogenase / glutarate-semialdehyde dehydrogenase
MGTIKSINPYDGSLLKEFQEYDQTRIDLSLVKAESAFQDWKQVSYQDRAVLMMKCGAYLNNQKNDLATLMVLEMGKPIKEAIAEIEKCAQACEFYADKASDFLADESIQSDASSSFVTYQPLGCVLAIMPWNFPFWQVFRFAAPAIMAGNVGILKHASNVPQCALAIEQVFFKSGFPEGIFQSLLIGASKVEYLIRNPIVKAVTLTGSERAGSEVASLAGKHIKKSVLELGGSDPFIVLKDADLELASSFAVRSRMINTGQSCIAAKRFIVVKEIADAFTEKMIRKMKKLKMGNPMDESTEVGTIAREDLVQPLLDQISKSIAKGAKLALGGDRPEMKGAFLSPAILTNVKPGMPAYEEEIFGPVASIIVAEDENDAIRIANDSRYGLGASIWTQDQTRGRQLARMIESGCVFINGMVKSDQRLPFGGIKNSGYGRELSAVGIREFVNVKTVWVK